MKPGESAASTVTFPHPSAIDRVALVMSAVVCDPGMTSTSGITGAGLKKCIPTTRPGAAQAAAIDVTDSDDVLVARMHSSLTTPSSARNSDCLASSPSVIASTASPHSAKSPSPAGSDVSDSLPDAASASAL